MLGVAVRQGWRKESRSAGLHGTTLRRAPGFPDMRTHVQTPRRAAPRQGELGSVSPRTGGHAQEVEVC